MYNNRLINKSIHWRLNREVYHCLSRYHMIIDRILVGNHLLIFQVFINFYKFSFCHLFITAVPHVGVGGGTGGDWSPPGQEFNVWGGDWSPPTDIL